MNPDLPGLLITPGEPAGIGPDIVLMLAQEKFDSALIAVADPDLLQQRNELLNLGVTIKEFSEPAPHQAGTLQVMPISLNEATKPGILNVKNAGYVLDTLTTATNQCLSKQFDALVTGPISKSIINDAGIEFSGHTEFLAEKSNADLPVMMLANNQLRVALVTTHLPLGNVTEAITTQRLEQVIRILHTDLSKYFKLKNPSIGVCGLNPHAGESGHLGKQEQEIIQPVINKLRSEGFCLTDPLPADTIFTAEVRKDFDVILSMYHDQGLPTLKALGFGETVNITLGLPIIRTSVDHGTALDLAGTGKASPSSLFAAVRQAEEIIRHQRR